MIYYGTVTRVDANAMVFVTIPELGGSAEIGPDPALGYAYAPGDRVVVSRLSVVAEDLIVLGPISTGEAIAVGGDIDGGTPSSTFTGEVDGGTP